MVRSPRRQEAGVGSSGFLPASPLGNSCGELTGGFNSQQADSRLCESWWSRFSARRTVVMTFFTSGLTAPPLPARPRGVLAHRATLVAHVEETCRVTTDRPPRGRLRDARRGFRQSAVFRRSRGWFSSSRVPFDRSRRSGGRVRLRLSRSPKRYVQTRRRVRVGVFRFLSQGGYRRPGATVSLR